MRQTRIVLAVIGLLLTAAPVVQAQHSAGLMNSACGCSACAQHGYCQECCPPLLPSITQGIHHVLGGLFCCPGLNARHDIYRAALNRNDFGKCSKYVPIYSCRTCGCGGRNPACPQCGPGLSAGGEEVIEMQDVPAGMQEEPTPALEPETPPMPADAVPPQATRIRVPQGQGRATMHRAAKPSVSSKTARSSTMRDRVTRATVGDENSMPVVHTAAQKSAKGSSLIERAMLLQTGSSEPVNTLRK